MINRNPGQFYQDRIEDCNRQIKKLKKKDTTLSILKVMLFFSGVLFLFSTFSKDPVSALEGFGIFFILFFAAAVLHENVLEKIIHLKRLIKINENELKMLSHQFPAVEEPCITGVEFRNPDHPYSMDLDIFGEKSIFHFLNRCVTSMGRKCLADWLQVPANREQIHLRQQAVQELAAKTDFRQNLQAHGLSIDDTSQKLESLFLLLNEPFAIEGRKFIIYFIHVLPLITVGLFIALAFKLPLAVPLVFVAIQWIINKKTSKTVARLYRLTSRNSKILKTYSRIIKAVEQEPFAAQKLQALKKDLQVNKTTASRSIKRFATLVEWFELRANAAMHFFINNTLFWDLHCVYRIEKWKKETASVIHLWFDVIAEIEALSSFANVSFNNPDWVFPMLIEKNFHLSAMALGHPLIPQSERVCNDLLLDNEKCILVVTGPNMAGKSTFLRTVGVNLVMAMAGAPVCADRFELSVMKLCTSLQTSDSLDKHLSLFYAELLRLKMILDAIAVKEHDIQAPVFFMIDEMLKGTNTLDRQKGSIVLIKQLLKQQAGGIIATHDLELTKLGQEEEKIVNAHFDGYVQEDRLLFDYKLKQGICESFNAVVLMRKIGIDV
jgi:DNA mismatch repair ATPase MutS